MMTRKAVLSIVAGLAVAGIPASRAEVQKSLGACGDHSFCATYRIGLTPPEGWGVDAAASEERGVQILVPKGTTFDSAPALIYVQVFFKPDKALSLAAFAEDSNKGWQAKAPTSKMTAQPEVARASGKPAFLRFAYDNPDKKGQTYELGAFGPDKDADGNDFVVNVVLSGDKAAVEKAEPVYVGLLKGL